MPEVTIATGEIVPFSDDWSEQEVRQGAADVLAYRRRWNRIPPVVRKDYIGEARPGDRTRDDVIDIGLALQKDRQAGRLTRGLYPDEQLALAIAGRQKTLDALTPAEKHTLGLSLSFPEQVVRGAREQVPAVERTWPEELGRAGRSASEAAVGMLSAPPKDLYASWLLEKLLPGVKANDPAWLEILKRLPTETVASVERVLIAPWAAAQEAIAQLTDDPHVQRLSRELFMWSSLAPQVAGGVKMLGRGAKRLGRWAEDVLVPPPKQITGLRPEFQPPPVRTMPHGPYESGYQPMPEPSMATPPGVSGPPARLPEPPPGPRALRAPGPGEAEYTVLGETRTAVPDPMAGEGWRRTPGPLISPRSPRLPKAPPYQRALPPPREGLQFGGPLDPSAPLPEVDVRPPAPPREPVIKAMGLPPMLEPPPSSIPKAPEKPARKPRTSTGKTKYQHVDLGTVNLSDPDEVRSLIEGLGGIRKADIEGIPFWMRGKDGVDFDVLVANISKEQKRPHKEIERQLGHTLKRYDQLRTDKRAKDAGKPRLESWETDVPDWVTDEDLWREE